MGQFPKSGELLRRVAQRLYLAHVGRFAYRVSLVLAGLYAALLLVSRFTGLIPDWFSVPSLLVVPVVAVLLSLLFLRRPAVADAARKVDGHERTKDLFLTLTTLDRAAGEYQPLVSRDAETRAPGIEPTAVVPWRWEPPTLRLAGVISLLVLGILSVPSFDPFGKVAAAKQAEQRVQDLQQTLQETQVRREQLVKQDVDAENSEEVLEALEQLREAFRKMIPEARKENAGLLAANQKSLGEKWKFNAEQLKALLAQTPLQQRFGERGELKSRDMLNQLKEGSSAALEQELDSVMEDLKDIAQMKDPLERSEAMQRLKKKLDNLREFARDDANSRPLSEALERAMQQLETAKAGDDSKLSSEAMQALQESIKLAELEAQKLAQSARDLQKLEEAMQAINMAKQANKEGLLDGQLCEDCESMSDYLELYAELMANREPGMGTGGEGIGKGSEVPEDDSIRTGSKDETTKAAIQKGKLLLAIKTKGVTEDDKDSVNVEYLEAVGQIRQSVSEAIEQEQVPPGYHDGIKKYFDSLEE